MKPANVTALLAITIILSVAKSSSASQLQQSGVVPPVAANTARPTAEGLQAYANSDRSISCYWLPAQGATGYTIVRDGKAVASLPATARSYVDAGLTPSTNYWYRVRSDFSGGQTTMSHQYLEQTQSPFPSTWTRRERTFDVVVLQASSSGVAAAIEAAKRGMRVALVEPTNLVGGMPTNGLSVTDLRKPYHLAGMMLDFIHNVKVIYKRMGVKADGITYSPRVALLAMRKLLYRTPGITLFRYAGLARVFTADNADGTHAVKAIRIVRLQPDGTPTGTEANIYGKVFIDSSDCGDLATAAGAPFRLGREARSKHEPHAGVIYYDRQNFSLLPGSTGRADKRVMSYAYLLVVKDYGPGTDHTISMPPGYSVSEFSHSPGWKDSWAYTSGRLPNNQYELNQHPEGNDLQEINYRYPVDGWKARARIEKQYRTHVLQYLYYIQTVQGMKELGMPDDDFAQTGGIPPLLYVREGRRILGQQVPEEWDITHARKVVRPNAIGIGDYPMDSHATEPKRNWSRPDFGEGEYWLYKITPWHQLPVGILVPRTLSNVWVTTAVSATHVAFGTYRLETVRMEFGQAAGVGAALMVKYGMTAPQVPYRQLQDALLPSFINPYGDAHAMLAFWHDIKPGSRFYNAIQFMGCRGFSIGQPYFHPDAPTTRGEMVQWLTLLAARTQPANHNSYFGRPANAAVLLRLSRLDNLSALATRAQIAYWLTALLGWHPESPANRYNDLATTQQQYDARALAAHSIDSVLWDGWRAIAPAGGLLFHPDDPLTHAEMMETLYLAQIGMGPAFGDDPVDVETVAQQCN